MKKKTFIFILCSLITMLIIGEFVSRFVLGLGDPPLSIPHPTIEYVFKPSSEFYRFGNYYKTNSYCMRSDEFTQSREKNEVRILVLGDSVVNGTSLIDQSELATELMKENLKNSLSIPVIVGNISAGTWSPPNLLAYIDEFGTFDTDVAIIILNKGDMFDFPTFEELSPITHPTQKPTFALGELVSRYVAPRICAHFDSRDDTHRSQMKEVYQKRKSCISELSEILEKFSEENIPVYLIYHPSKDEILPDGSFEPKEGYSTISGFTEKQSLRLYSFLDIYAESIKDNKSLFINRNHPNAAGQMLMAEYILKLLENESLINQWSQRR